MGTLADELRAKGHRVIERTERTLEDGTLIWWHESAAYSGKYVVALLLPNGAELSAFADSVELGIGELLSALDATVKAMKKLALAEGVVWLTVPDARMRRRT